MRIRPFRYRLLFVGVNHCPDGGHLRAAVRDAEALSSRFRSWGYWDDCSNALLTGPMATAESIREHLVQASQARDLDLLLLYWAGHMCVGPRGERLVAEDTTRTEAGLTELVGLGQLTLPLINARNVRNRVLILDTCHAGSAASHMEGLAGLVPPKERLVVLSGCSHDEGAREDRRQGRFTGALLDRLVPPAPQKRRKTDYVDLLAAFQETAQFLVDQQIQQPYFFVRGPGSHMRIPVLQQTSLQFD